MEIRFNTDQTPNVVELSLSRRQYHQFMQQVKEWNSGDSYLFISQAERVRATLSYAFPRVDDSGQELIASLRRTRLEQDLEEGDNISYFDTLAVHLTTIAGLYFKLGPITIDRRSSARLYIAASSAS